MGERVMVDNALLREGRSARGVWRQQQLYTDGGSIGPNPSPRGGTWAWTLVADDGLTRLKADSGCVTPSEAGLPTVSNNYAELLAAVLALEACPEGWDGTLFTDSLVTSYRVERRPPEKKPARMNGIPDDFQARLHAARGRLGAYCVVVLGGHPTADELWAGRTRNGLPCSAHNVYCDAACAAEARRFLGKGGEARC